MIKMKDSDEIGFTKNNLPKGCTITYLKDNDPKFHYLYCPLFTKNKDIEKWISDSTDFVETNNYTEIKFWYRYECTLVERNRKWWSDNVDIYINIIKIYYL